MHINVQNGIWWWFPVLACSWWMSLKVLCKIIKWVHIIGYKIIANIFIVTIGNFHSYWSIFSCILNFYLWTIAGVLAFYLCSPFSIVTNLRCSPAVLEQLVMHLVHIELLSLRHWWPVSFLTLSVHLVLTSTISFWKYFLYLHCLWSRNLSPQTTAPKRWSCSINLWASMASSSLVDFLWPCTFQDSRMVYCNFNRNLHPGSWYWGVRLHLEMA